MFFEAMQSSDLTPRQYAVLVAVAAQEDLSQTEIVEATGIDGSALADIVKRLVTRRLLARRRAKRDARAYSVNLTAAGRSIVHLPRQNWSSPGRDPGIVQSTRTRVRDELGAQTCKP